MVMPPNVKTFVSRIVSGGQTGADRAALDWAIRHGIAHGGWCPAGRRAEDGPIPAIYQLTETPSKSYQQRTKWNVRDSDATLILSQGPEISGGSKRTQEYAEALGKPCLHLHAGLDRVALLDEFLTKHAVATLNVAGPRESTEPGIGEFVEVTLEICQFSMLGTLHFHFPQINKGPAACLGAEGGEGSTSPKDSDIYPCVTIRLTDAQGRIKSAAGTGGAKPRRHSRARF
jgi:hypothetical protein